MMNFAKRSLSMLLALVMCLGLMSGIVLPEAQAASYTYNWGTREDVADTADFTRSSAEEWYAKYNTSYAELAALSGSSTQSSVPSSDLYRELKSLMTNAHTTKTSYDGTKSMYQYTDCQNGGGSISSFYSGKSIGPAWGQGDWNREHTWPKSKSLNGGSNGGQDESDIIMLRPTSTSENSSRGNTAYGESGSYYHPNSESDGKYDLRGDCARICLYVYVRWGNTQYMWGGSGVMQSRDVLLKWMEEDPVDTWELGRNDSCQSITGTRNVFVDYPELGFLMLGADVPDNYQSPSGAGSAVAYNITAKSNNTTYGTVSLSGKTITATPKTGYYASGYTVSSGKATVTQEGNTFRVTPESDCTITINFAAKTAVKLTFMENGTTAKTINSYGGDSVTLPSNTNAVVEGYTFVGWTDGVVNDTTTKPTIYNAGSTVTASNKTYYAVYTWVDGENNSGNWTRVESTTDLRTGNQYILAHSASGKVAGGLNGKYLDPLTATFTSDGKEITSLPSGVMPFTLGGNSSAWTLTNEAGQALGSTSEKTMLLGTASNWTITITNGTAVVKTSAGTLQYNTDSPRFTTYANASQQSLNLYTMGGTVYYTTSTFVCEHEDTSQVDAQAATCTQSGYTAGVYCNDCDQFISGCEEIAALGHAWGAWEQTTAPTCTVAGVETATCSRCGEKKTQSVAAKGHSYTSVVTKPTETTQGYTTYTCSTCGYSYKDNYTDALGETFYVSFNVPEGITKPATMECGKNGITLPTANAPEGYKFEGWTTAPVEDTETKPTVFTSSYTATANITLYAVYSYTEGGSGVTEYVLTDIANIKPDDVFVITMAKGTTLYALPNGAISKNPVPVTLSASNGKLTTDPAANLLWNLGGSADAWIFYPDGVTNRWLFCNNNNTGVAVGTGSANTYKISGDYLYHNGTKRYVGVYTGNPDWRCYTSSSTNIGGQTLGFYVKTQAGTTYYTTLTAADPVASVNGVEYGSLAEAYAASNGQMITMLDSVGIDGPVSMPMDQDMLLDLNGHYVDIIGTAGYTVTVKDSTTDDFSGGFGALFAENADVQACDGYLMIDGGEDEGLSFHHYELKLLAVSLDAKNDALGYKAQFFGDELVCSMVTGFGFNMGVVYEKTYELADTLTNGQVFTLRLHSIMAHRGGEMAITASAFVNFGETAVTTDSHITTMKQTIVAVNQNWDTYTTAQRSAVQELYQKYSTVMSAWLGEENNITQ